MVQHSHIINNYSLSLRMKSVAQTAALAAIASLAKAQKAKDFANPDVEYRGVKFEDTDKLSAIAVAQVVTET